MKKVKQIVIDAKVHEDFKNLCDEECFKMKPMIERLIQDFISKVRYEKDLLIEKEDKQNKVKELLRRRALQNNKM